MPLTFWFALPFLIVNGAVLAGAAARYFRSR